MVDPYFTYLILDHNRPAEAHALLTSLKENTKVDYDILYLSNGGIDYTYGLVEAGLLEVDQIIRNKRNVGCGAGTIQLFANCQTRYAIYLQVDHFLDCEITEGSIDLWSSLIATGKAQYIDLAGNQGNGEYSERAQFVDIHWYNNIPKAIGGPGPWHHVRWTENCMQEHVRKVKEETGVGFLSARTLDMKPIFTDVGIYSVRTNPDGSRWRIRTDTKEVWLEGGLPKEKYVFPEFTDEEWNVALRGEWPDGAIPENYKPHSFNYWK